MPIRHWGRDELPAEGAREGGKGGGFEGRVTEGAVDYVEGAASRWIVGEMDEIGKARSWGFFDEERKLSLMVVDRTELG